MVKLKGFSSFHNFHYEESGNSNLEGISVGKGQTHSLLESFFKTSKDQLT